MLLLAFFNSYLILLGLHLTSGAVAVLTKGTDISIGTDSTGTLVARALTVEQQNAFMTQNRKIRGRLNIPELVWNTSLEDGAMKWAQHLASINQAIHSNQTQRRGMGENIFSFKVKEREQFKPAPGNIFTKKVASQGVANYTQIVWRDTKSIGIAAVKNTTVSGSTTRVTWYVVARYSPQGNVIGKQIY